MLNTSLWLWPQWTMAGTYAFSLLMTAILHGRPRSGNYNFPVALIASSFGVFVLAQGGFFK